MIGEKNKALIKQFWGLAEGHKKGFFISFALSFVILAMELARPLLLNEGLGHMEQGNAEDLRMTAWIFLGVSLVDYFARSGYSALFSLSLLRTIAKIRGAVFNHVLHMKMAFFDKQPVGVLLTRTINDCEALGETLRVGAANIVIDLLAVIIVLGVLIKIDLGLTTAFLISGPILLWLIKWAGAKLRDKFLDVRKALAASNGFMAEGIMGVEILQLFRQTQDSANEYREINKDYRRATIINNVYDATLYAFIDGIAAAVTALILFMAFNMRFGVLEVSVVIVYLSQVDRIFVPIRDLSSRFAVIQQALAALDRVFTLLNSEAHIHQGDASLKSKSLDIDFKDVRFRYQEDGPLVLDGISFSVKPGQTVALVGQTGSGKSTIGKLLTRAYDGYEGHIRVGGVELKDLNYHSLRSNIGVVHQEIELFPGSLRDNITMFNPNIEEAMILDAIRMVKATHMVEELQGGLDFEVSENGGNLSAGQKQLIVFARALAHDTPIVLMDEATSSVDSVTEAWIQEAIAAIMKEKTVMVVAHRLSTIAAADRILVLKGGSIQEEGSHDELLALEDGYYASLVEASELQHASEGGVML